MTEREIDFAGWSQGPMTVPRAIFEVGDERGRSFVVSFEVPESVRSRLAATEQGDDEPDGRFVERVQEALRTHGEEVVQAIVEDPDRRGVAEREGHLLHEVAGPEFHRLTAHLPSSER